MRSFTIVVVIIAFVAIVAKRSSVSTHDSYTQALRRRPNTYNYGKREQYNMFLRRVAQHLVDDEDSDESFRAIMRKRVSSVSNNGPILGVSTDYKLYTRATLGSDWLPAPNTNGAVIAVTQLNDGRILGVGTGGTLWTRDTLGSDWLPAPNTNGAVIAVTQLNYPPIKVCSPSCQNGGTCTAPNTCTCLSQYSGAKCEIVNNDNIKNGDESDVDCGGSSGKKCAVGKTCKVTGDCDNVLCTGGVCQNPSCSDGLKNGGETDVDCGGSGSCPRCDNWKRCSSPTDCVSKVCSGNQCQAPMDHDNVMNGDESDVDCGGSSGKKCAVGKTCKVTGDCDNVLCTGGFCSILGMNLVINGDAETGDCSKTKPYDKQPTGWKYTGSPIQVAYAAEWNQDNSTPGPSDRGQCYFAGYETANNSMWQTININDATTLSLLDSEKVSANLSAWLGGYYSQDDNAKVTLNFYNQDGTKIGNAITIGPVLAVDREKKSELLFRTNNGKVPAGTRSMIVLVEFTIINGRDNDGAADNIAVVLSASG